MTTDKVVGRVCQRFVERSWMGQQKYGHTLDRRDIDANGWLNHLQEELMDAVLYIERLKEERKHVPVGKEEFFAGVSASDFSILQPSTPSVETLHSCPGDCSAEEPCDCPRR